MIEGGNILQQVLLYFAKFPNYSGVVGNFQNVNGSDGYKAFKLAIEGLSEKSLIPSIENYVFGSSEKSIILRLQKISGIYLFIDYGAIESSITALNVKHDYFDLAATIARPGNGSVLDPMEELIELDEMLSITREIQRYLREDKDDPFVRMLSDTFDIVPFVSEKLLNSVGWTLIFKVKGVNFI